MKQLVKDLVKKTPLYSPLKFCLEKRRLREWEKMGKPCPPPHIVKQRTLKEYKERFGLEILVETGTNRGAMVYAMKNHFSRVYSIELSKELYKKAVERFACEDTVEIIEGDSGVELGKLIGRLDKPTLFWLDGHYSAGVTAKGDKDTPIFEELTHIFNLANIEYVVIIDDARCFGSDEAYPSMEDLRSFIKDKKPESNIGVIDDTIRITYD